MVADRTAHALRRQAQHRPGRDCGHHRDAVGRRQCSEARELSAVLLEAADEVDRWTQSHGTVQR